MPRVPQRRADDAASVNRFPFGENARSLAIVQTVFPRSWLGEVLMDSASISAALAAAVRERIREGTWI